MPDFYTNLDSQCPDRSLFFLKYLNPKNSITETFDRTFFSDTKHNDNANIDHEFERRSISNFVVDNIPSDKLSETPDKIIQIEDAIGTC